MSTAIVKLVTDNGATFLVHEGILGHHSKPFRDETSGAWTDPQPRKIRLKGWDESTVGQLVQFLYTGDYRYPSPGATETRDPEPIPSGSESDNDSRSSRPSTPAVRQRTELTPFHQCVRDISWKDTEPLPTDAEWLATVDAVQFDFEKTLLAHAAVYALASNKAITPLKGLAHGRLSHTLLKLHPFGRNRHLPGGIARLAKFAYANTHPGLDTEEPLRRIVSQYVALNFAAWQAHPVAVKMMCAGGDFVKDGLEKICIRLGAVELTELQFATAGTRYISRFGVGRSPP